MAINNNNGRQTKQVLLRVRSWKDPHTLPVRTEDGTAALGTHWQYHRELTLSFSFSPVIPGLGFYWRETIAHAPAKTRVQIFIVALFMRRRSRMTREPAAEWINEMWCHHTVEYYSEWKKKMKYSCHVDEPQNLLQRQWRDREGRRVTWMKCTEKADL